MSAIKFTKDHEWIRVEATSAPSASPTTPEPAGRRRLRRAARVGRKVDAGQGRSPWSKA